jgi:glycosyltransferase involved in cell wall biosynthesis
MLCSIVIPWHRDLDELRRAIDSVLSQTYQNFEIIVVANGDGRAQTDDVRALTDDARLTVAHNEPGDASAARNLGIKMARGHLIFFLDADDIFYANKLAHFVALHGRTDFDLAFSRGLRLRGNGVSWAFPALQWDGLEPISEFFFCKGCTISASAIVIDTRKRNWLHFARACGSFEDPDLVMRAAANGFKVEMAPEILYQWSDERVGNRLSQLANFDERLAWIDRIGPAATPRARAAFKARYVAQHDLPRNPRRNLSFIAGARRLRAVPASQLALFLVRALIPRRLQRGLLNTYFLARQRKVMV